MFDLLDHFFHQFVTVYFADRRPDARKFTIGCFLMIVIFIGLLSLIFWDTDTGPAR